MNTIIVTVEYRGKKYQSAINTPEINSDSIRVLVEHFRRTIENLQSLDKKK